MNKFQQSINFNLQLEQTELICQSSITLTSCGAIYVGLAHLCIDDSRTILSKSLDCLWLNSFSLQTRAGNESMSDIHSVITFLLSLDTDLHARQSYVEISELHL